MILGRILRDEDKICDWDDVKHSIMIQGLRLKFQDPILRKKLLGTGDAIIHENNPDDYYWGRGKDGSGESWLGQHLMRVRDEIREEVQNSGKMER